MHNNLNIPDIHKRMAERVNTPTITTKNQTKQQQKSKNKQQQQKKLPSSSAKGLFNISKSKLLCFEFHFQKAKLSDFLTFEMLREKKNQDKYIHIRPNVS